VTALRLPPDFTWGVATSAYQIEGAVTEDGRGESIWDRFTSFPGAILGGDDGSVACDSYHCYPDDVRLMRELGLNAYRFSVAWPRVLPEGRGRTNPTGLDYYDRLVDELLEAGIEPFVTLYHWDLPQALEDRGGWPVREIVDAYAEYVEIVVARLGDRVRHWITQCEPWVIAWLGYGSGEHAPGRRSEHDALAAAHHVLLAHGRGVEVVRRESPGAEVGITIDLVRFHPLTESEEDAAAVARADGLRNRWILDPVLRGAYPEDVVDRFAAVGPLLEVGDLRLRTILNPGHTPGSTSFLLEGSPVLFTGDTLFPGGPGNTQSPEGNFPLIIESIDRRLFTLDPDLLVMPGHGLDTTVGNERPHIQEWVDRGW